MKYNSLLPEMKHACYINKWDSFICNDYVENSKYVMHGVQIIMIGNIPNMNTILVQNHY